MLFMGEEYGEPAPFQFFCDHVDPDIAQATREGRRREFASFASFGHEIPDPQDRATFLASKLTRVVDEPLARLYRELLRARPTLQGEALVSFDEGGRWLRVRREGGELLCNFGHVTQSFEVAAGARVVVSTHGGAPQDGRLELGPLAGALVA
jgi:maltooligosyltrehalose trehalohydrolase